MWKILGFFSSWEELSVNQHQCESVFHQDSSEGTKISVCSACSETPIKIKRREELEINIYVPPLSRWTPAYHKQLVQL